MLCASSSALAFRARKEARVAVTQDFCCWLLLLMLLMLLLLSFCGGRGGKFSGGVNSDLALVVCELGLCDGLLGCL